MISTKGRYALRVMADLAEQDTEQFVPLKEIAKRQGISEKYLESIVRILVKEKLLKGLSGKGGGYRLTRRPEEYTAGEILELTEGTLAVVACLEEGAKACARKKTCRIFPMWEQFDGMIREFFFSITLSDLLKGYIGKEDRVVLSCQKK
ncbi:MAG: Rrf2 family transcriptional regulator [Lachnospiraceae bacterium]|jgi:Rrf2 family iron-sulfur cluster assembly transcriptional regulator|nr:Rrf2 family transcriptional regulator [Lachnospiraceae bacterium]